jgi:hypothetical protein
MIAAAALVHGRRIRLDLSIPREHRRAALMPLLLRRIRDTRRAQKLI